MVFSFLVKICGKDKIFKIHVEKYLRVMVLSNKILKNS